MENELIGLVKKAEELKKEKNISLLEAYNIILTGYDFSLLSEEQLKGLIMILKTELAENDDNRPLIMRFTLIVSSVINVLMICLGNLIPIDAISGLWYVLMGYWIFKSFVIASSRLQAAKTNKSRQYNIADCTINTLIDLAYTESVNRNIKEEFTKNNNKCTESYIGKLLKAIEELMPLVSYDKISFYGMECLRLRSVYNKLFKNSDSFLSLMDTDIYKENPELLVQQLESLLDNLIEETSPTSALSVSLDEARRRANKK